MLDRKAFYKPKTKAFLVVSSAEGLTLKRDTLDSNSHLSWVTHQELTELLLLGGSVARGFQQMDKDWSLQCLSERTLLPKGIPLRWYWLKLEGRSSFTLSVRHCQVCKAAWQLSGCLSVCSAQESCFGSGPRWSCSYSWARSNWSLCLMQMSSVNPGFLEAPE